MSKTLLALAALLLAAGAVEASNGRDLLAVTCNPRTQKKCGNKCVPFLTDRNNCGNCGVKCGLKFVCRTGGCVCPASLPSQCGTPAKCVNTANDNMNCGSCGNVCATGKCIKGKCPGDDNCPVNQKQCRGVCRFVDNANCGDCGVVCRGSTVCVGGGCICPRAKPDVCVAGTCTNKMTDRRNCGTCGKVCPRGKRCVKGACA